MLGSPALTRRTRVSLSSEQLVSFERMSRDGARAFPLTIEPNAAGVDLAAWIAGQSAHVEQLLLQHAALLFRGFEVTTPAAFSAIARALSGELESYTERAAPRREVDQRIYTSTEYAADLSIPLHHEMSYARRWPAKVWFYCAVPAPTGGATPITDDRIIIERIPGHIRDTFVRRGLTYVRNYGGGIDLSWQDTFQTTDRSVVEDYCRRTGIDVEWRNGDRLRTRQPGHVMVRHPVTADTVWFNHAHLFHVSSLPARDRQALLRQFDDDELPRNVFHADGSRIPDEALEEIRNIYAHSAERFTWRPFDVLLLDNILASHGRDPFEGDRRILVAMAGMHDDPGRVA